MIVYVFYVGRSMEGYVVILDMFNWVFVFEIEVMYVVKQDDNIVVFLLFFLVYWWEVDMFKDYYEVRFIDLCYWSKGYYLFVVIVYIGYDFMICLFYIGWIFSEEKFQKKLKFGFIQSWVFFCFIYKIVSSRLMRDMSVDILKYGGQQVSLM